MNKINPVRFIPQLARVHVDGGDPEAPDNETRREQGRIHCSNLMLYWFSINEWTHPNFADLCDWALNEDRAVHPSQISHIRNRKMRMFGLRVLDGFGAVNLAVWAANTDSRLLTDLGVRPMTPEIRELVDGKQAIMHPHTGLPMGQGDWIELFLGHFKVPQVLSGVIDPGSEEFKNAAEQVGPYLNDVIMSTNYDVMTACNKIQEKLGAQKAQSVMSLIMGFRQVTPEELQEELLDIAQAANALDGMERTPSDLIQKLGRRKKRNGNGKAGGAVLA